MSRSISTSMSRGYPELDWVLGARVRLSIGAFRCPEAAREGPGAGRTNVTSRRDWPIQVNRTGGSCRPEY